MIDQRILDKAIRDLQEAKAIKLTGLRITIDKRDDYWPSMPSLEAIDIVKNALEL